jgi:hypothetical protein
MLALVPRAVPAAPAGGGGGGAPRKSWYLRAPTADAFASWERVLSKATGEETSGPVT